MVKISSIIRFDTVSKRVRIYEVIILVDSIPMTLTEILTDVASGFSMTVILSFS